MPRPLLDSRQLRHVVTLAKYQSFRRAAEALFITQPALTKSIRNLEDLLEVPLFDREASKVTATAYCEVLLQHAKPVLHELQEIQHKLDELSNIQRGSLKIGSGPVAVHIYLSDAVSLLVQKHPKISISVVVDNWHELAKHLRAGDIDLFIGDIGGLQNDSDLEILPLIFNESIFVCRPEHPLMATGNIHPEDLLRYPLALPKLPERFVDWFKGNLPEGADLDQFINNIQRIQCDSYPFLKGLVSNSDYLTRGQVLLFESELESGTLCRLNAVGFKGGPLGASPGVVTLKSRTLPPAGRAFVDLIRAQYIEP